MYVGGGQVRIVGGYRSNGCYSVTNLKKIKIKSFLLFFFHFYFLFFSHHLGAMHAESIEIIIIIIMTDDIYYYYYFVNFVHVQSSNSHM